MNIELNDKYRIGSDRHQYILEEFMPNSKNPDNDRWLGVLFFSSIKSLLNYVPEYLARQEEDITTMPELINNIKFYHKLVQTAEGLKLP